VRNITIEIYDLTITFSGENVLTVDFFSITSSDRILLTGPSGSGKTVFLATLLSLLPPSSITSGIFVIHDNKTSKKMEYSQYRRVGISKYFSVMFQDPVQSLHPLRTLKKQWESIDPQILEKFNLKHEQIGLKVPKDCSGGECQRSCLAIGSENLGEKILVLDEPLSDIDQISLVEIRKHLTRLIRDSQQGLVIVTHKPEWLFNIDLPIQHYKITGKTISIVGSGSHRSGQERTTVIKNPRKEIDNSTNIFINSRTKPSKVRDTRNQILSLAINEHYRFSGTGGFHIFPASLEIDSGETVGILGESGSGKSSLLRIASGLFPRSSYKSAFDVEFNYEGKKLEPIFSRSSQSRSAHIQLVVQNTSGSMVPNETVRQHLRWIEKARMFSQSKNNAGVIELAEYWAEKLDLFSSSGREGFLNKRLDTLSIGMLRRFSLLRSLILLTYTPNGNSHTSKLLMLDEVSRGLDPDRIQLVVETLHEFRKETNAAIIIVSHDVDFIIHTCNRVHMVLEGLLLPTTLNIKEIEEMKNGGGGFLNPYYKYFFSGQEVKDEPVNIGRNSARQKEISGCIYKQLYECRNIGKKGCTHDQLRLDGRIGICS